MPGAFAKLEHATIVERTQVGLEPKAETGGYVGGSGQTLSGPAGPSVGHLGPAACGQRLALAASQACHELRQQPRGN
jgi:hypothetical protein